VKKTGFKVLPFKCDLQRYNEDDVYDYDSSDNEGRWGIGGALQVESSLPISHNL
jgi:hypothetical protein